MTPTRAYPMTYRSTELRLIFQGIGAGESVSIIAVSGMGKSNLFRHMLRADVQRRYLGDRSRDYTLVAVDAHALFPVTDDAFYRLLIERLIEQGGGSDMAALIPQLEKALVGAARSALPGDLARAFAACIKLVMTADENRRLVFVLDQLDDIYQQLDPRLLTTLRALRDEYKGRLSYVTLTRDDMECLGSQKEHKEFYELFTTNIVGLGAHNHDDACLVISVVAKSYGITVTQEVSERIIALCGGHPGLLKAAIVPVLRNECVLPAEDIRACSLLLQNRAVERECVDLWACLRADERDALALIALGRPLPASPADLAIRLRRKGILAPGADRIFSPIFVSYIIANTRPPQPETVVQAGPVRIDAANNVWVDSLKREASFGALEIKLLRHLCSKQNQVCSKDEISIILHPELYAKGEYMTDEAIATLVKRVRERLGDTGSTGRLIVTIKNVGYMLKTA